jgi:hypothetical protein
MSVLYRCEECGDLSPSPDAVGWVEVRPLGGHPILPPDPTHLCRLCWAHAIALVRASRSGPALPPQVSEHTQNRDMVQGG